MSASTAGGSSQIVVAGAGYAGLHVALRLAARLRDHPLVEPTLVDRHGCHQAITELPRLAGGTRAADAVRIPLQDTLATQVRFVQTEIAGFDPAGRRLLTGAGPTGWRRLMLALGSRSNDFAIPGLAQRTLSLYSAGDAELVWEAVSKALTAAAAAAELAEILSKVASHHGLAADRPTVQLVEAGPAILAGSSPQLINKAVRILSDLGVQVRTNAVVAAATEEGCWVSSRTIGVLTASLVLLAAWVAAELRVPDPLIDPQAASRRAVLPRQPPHRAGLLRSDDRHHRVHGGLETLRRIRFRP